MNTGEACFFFLLCLFVYFCVVPLILWFDPLSKLKTVLCSKLRLFRSLLEAPFVWKWAVRFVQRNFDHTPDSTCIVCAAKARQYRVLHRPFANSRGAVICKVCSMPVAQWKKNPVCSGKTAPYVEAVEQQPRVKIIRTDWN